MNRYFLTFARVNIRRAREILRLNLAMRGLLVLLLVAGAALGQSSSSHWIRHTFTGLTETGATSPRFTQISQEGRIPDKHEIIADVSGSPVTCTFQMQGSATGSSPWIDMSGDQDCSADMAVGVINRFFPFVRVNLSALSGGTTPSVVFTYIGVAQ